MFKKLFVLFPLLTLCVLPFGDIGHTEQSDAIQQSIERLRGVDDSTPFKYKVYVAAYKEDSVLEKRLQTFVKRELRAFGNFEIVNLDDEWDFIFSYNVMENELKDGSKSGWLSIAASLAQAVPKSHFKNYDYPAFLKPVYIPRVTSAHWGADNLLEFAIGHAADIDKILVELRSK